MTELVFIHFLSTASSWHSTDFSLNILAYITTHHTKKTKISKNMQACWLSIQIYFPQDYRGCCLRLEWNVEPQEDGFGPLDQTLNQKDLCTQQTHHSWWATSTFAFALLLHSITHTHAHRFCKAEAIQDLFLCLCLHFMITEHSSAQKSVFLQQGTGDLFMSCCI